MSFQTHRLATTWLAEGVAAMVVVVLESRGSAPRDAGTRMLVSATRVSGTVGGGHLELKAIEHARLLMQAGARAGLSATPLPMSVYYPLGPALGQCCGGTVTLGFAPLDSAALRSWPVPAPLFNLQMYGAGHVGRAIARLLSTLDVQVTWIDEREEEFPSFIHDGTGGFADDTACAPADPLDRASRAELGSQRRALHWPAHIKTLCVDAVEDEVRHALPGSYFLVLTHNHDLDMRITEAILERGDFEYLGLIGSHTKRQRFVHRFERRGFSTELIARMTCPIGIEGIEGKQPEIIAMAVVAQLLQAATQTTGR